MCGGTPCRSLWCSRMPPGGICLSAWVMESNILFCNGCAARLSWWKECYKGGMGRCSVTVPLAPARPIQCWARCKIRESWCSLSRTCLPRSSRGVETDTILCGSRTSKCTMKVFVIFSPRDDPSSFEKMPSRYLS